MSSGDTWDVRHLPWERFSQVAAYTEGWPTFAQAWYGGEFPSGRGLAAKPEPGWTCRCGRGYNPRVMQCYYCPATETAPGPAAQSRDLTWTPDACEPDET